MVLGNRYNERLSDLSTLILWQSVKWWQDTALMRRLVLEISLCDNSIPSVVYGDTAQVPTHSALQHAVQKEWVTKQRCNGWKSDDLPCEGLTEEELEGFSRDDLGFSLVVAAATWVGGDREDCSEAKPQALECELFKLTAEPSQMPDTD